MAQRQRRRNGSPTGDHLDFMLGLEEPQQARLEADRMKRIAEIPFLEGRPKDDRVYIIQSEGGGMAVARYTGGREVERWKSTFEDGTSIEHWVRRAHPEPPPWEKD